MNSKVTIKYDGSRYNGWQSQHGNNGTITIEDEVIKAVSFINKQPTKIVASGRTDRGVHALAQVFNFENTFEIENDRLKFALNNLLPNDIEVISVESVTDMFHSRFSAKSKEYHYYLNNGEYNLFENNYITHFKSKLDLTLMQSAAKLLIGTHNFEKFNATPLEVKRNQVITITKFDIVQTGDRYIFKIEGSSFLRYMVRMLVGTVVYVGCSKYTLDTVSDFLNNDNSNKAPYKIAANGLYLYKVNY